MGNKSIGGRNIFVFVGLSVLAVSLFFMSRVADEKKEDSRILGVHNLPTATPTPKPKVPTPTIKYYPTPTPTPFINCKADGSAVSSASMCCSGYAVYVWSSYVCGELKPTSTPFPRITKIPTVKLTPRPTIISTENGTVSYPVPTINILRVTPTKVVKNCETAVLDAECVGVDGKTCKWFRGTDCVWVCNRNCVELKKCQTTNLGTSCTNDKGQNCQQRQKSDCSISCDLNCKSTVTSNFSLIFKTEKKDICNFGIDYNKDGAINSLDIVFCNKKPDTEVAINQVVERVRTNIPLWFEWITAKFGW